jgi:hypothetical protein
MAKEALVQSQRVSYRMLSVRVMKIFRQKNLSRADSTVEVRQVGPRSFVRPHSMMSMALL